MATRTRGNITKSKGAPAKAAPKAKADPVETPKLTPEERKAVRLASLAKARETRNAEKVLAAEAAAQEVSDAAAKHKVDVLAKEINTRFVKARDAEAKGDDHRLAAALRLGEVKAALDKENTTFFKLWVEANITEQSYHNCRQLAAIGYSGDEETAREALDNARKANAQRNAGYRAAAQQLLEDRSEGGEEGETEEDEGKKSAGTAKRPITKAMDAMAKIKPVEAVGFLKRQAEKLGLKLIGANVTDKAVLKGMDQYKIGSGVDGDASEAGKAAFTAMTAPEKMAFLEWATAEVGMDLVNPFDATEEAEPAPKAASKKKAA